MWLARFWLISLVAAASLLAQSASKAEPVKIRVSWIAPLSNWASLLMEKKELAKHMGQSYVLEPVRYAGTPTMITALASGELEVANLAYSTLPTAIHNAGLSDLRVISDEFQDGVKDYYSQEYMVLADGPVKRLQDMKGRVIATNAGGSAVDVAMRSALRKVGARTEARLCDGRGATADHARHAGRQESRSGPTRGAVLVRSAVARHRQAAVLQSRCDGADATAGVVRAAILHRQEPRRDGRLHGGHPAHHLLVSRPGKPRGGRGDRLAVRPSSRPSGWAGSSPRRTTTMRRACGPISMRCSATSR